MRRLDIDLESTARPVEDNVGQRLGVGVAVSIGINALVLFGLAWAHPELPKAIPGDKIVWREPTTLNKIAKKMNHKTADKSQKLQPVIKPVVPEEEEIKRPETPVKERIDTKPVERGPRVVITPQTHPPLLPQESASKNKAEDNVGNAASPGKPNPVQMTPRESGGAAMPGNPFEVSGTAHRVPEQAQSHAASPAAAVGRTVAIMTSAMSATSAASQNHPLISKSPTTPAYVPVPALQVRDNVTGFVVASVDSVRAARGISMNALPARTTVPTTAMGTVTAIGTVGGSMEGTASSSRTVSLKIGAPGQIYLSSKSTGSAFRFGEAKADVAGATGAGRAASGRTQGAEGARHTMGTAGTVGGTAQVKDGLGNGLTVETGTGGSPHTVSGAKGAGIRGSLGNGGGVADTIVGGEGVVKATAGTSDGTVKIGKVGGTVAPLTSIGFSGQGPVALPGGPGGPVVPGPGPLPPKPIPDTDLDEVEVDSPVITQQGAKVVQKPAFELTPSLQHRHVKGMVEVRVEVDADNAATVTLKKSSGDTELDDAVVHYIQSWKWQAAKQDGASIKSGRIIRFRVN